MGKILHFCANFACQ